MICVGFDVSGKSLGSDAITQRKQRVCEGKQLVSQAGLRALLRQLGAKLDNFEVGNQMKGDRGDDEEDHRRGAGSEITDYRQRRAEIQPAV